MDNNEITLSSLIEAKNQRKQAEMEVQRLRNRLNNLKKQEKLSANNVERMRKLSEKINQVREVKYEGERKKKEKRRRESEEIDMKKEEYRKRSYESCFLKDESIKKRIIERKTEYFNYKNWIKEIEEDMVQEAKKKKEENLIKKEMMLEHKRKVAIDRKTDIQGKFDKAQELWQERVNREQSIYKSKNLEKDLFLDIDLTILEMMQTHRL